MTTYCKMIDINLIQIGDIVEHDGKLMTVGKENIKYDEFIGKSIFGDCYHCGYKKVKLIDDVVAYEKDHNHV